VARGKTALLLRALVAPEISLAALATRDEWD
jgi:hypothetical protein